MFNMRFIVSCNLVDYNEYKIKGTVLLVCGRMGCFIYLASGNQKPSLWFIDSRLSLMK